MTEEVALIFDIEKFAVHNGPGIRTTTKSLRVRVSGFSSCFTLLNKHIQDNVIERILEKSKKKGLRYV